jgi:hypothetical protein
MYVFIIRGIITERQDFFSADDRDFSGTQADNTRARQFPLRRRPGTTLNSSDIVRFQVLTAASMMFRAVFWVILQSFYTAV